MTLSAINDKSKCAGESDAGSNVCADRARCGRYLRPEGDRQTWDDFWKAGRDCQWYEIVPASNHQSDWDEIRIDVIGANGNDGLHYEPS